MAIKQAIGLEMGTLGEFNTVTGALSASSSQAYTGTYSLRCNPTASIGYFIQGGGVETYYRFSFCIYIVTAPDADFHFMDKERWNLVLTTDRYIDL